jgi:uncharacterized protein YybS (DUF2232 family)
MTIPFLGITAIMFIPLPIFFYYVKSTKYQGIAIYFTSLAIVIAITISWGEPISSPIIFVVLGLIGLVLGETFRKGLSIEKMILYPVILAVTVLLLMLIYASIRAHHTPLHIISVYVDSSIQESIKVLEQTGLSTEDLAMIRENAGKIRGLLADFFPSMLLVGLTFMTWINIIAARYLFGRAGIDCSSFADLSRWKVPDHIIWLFIIAVGAILIPLKEVQVTGLNILIPLIFTYFLQGLAIISYFFRQKMVPPPLRLIVYIFTFTFQFIPIAVAALGLFDLWIDFRKYISVKDNRPPE